MTTKGKKKQQFFTDKKLMASEERALSQCFLLKNLDTLLKKKSKFANCPSSFLSIKGDPSVLLGRVLRQSKQERFLEEIHPHELSALVPEIRLFKVYYNPKNPKDTHQKEFFFDSHLTKQDLQSIFRQQTNQRMSGVGLKSCDWEFIGSTPAESKRLVKVNLKILFSSIQDLKKKHSSGVSFVELISLPHGNNKTIMPLVDANHHVKLQVGWSVPDGKHSLFKNKPELLDAIKDMSMSMFLSLSKPDLNFEQDGKITLNLGFWGRLESVVGVDGAFDVLDPSSTASSVNKHIINSVITAKTELQERLKMLKCVKKSAERRNNKYALRKVKVETKDINKSLQKLRKYQGEYIVSEKKERYEKLLLSLFQSNKIYFETTSAVELGIEDEKVKKRSSDTNFELNRWKCSSVSSYQANSFLQKFKNNVPLARQKKSLNANKLRDSRIPKVDDCLIIHYFFLGDLLDIILGEFYKTNKEKRIKFLLGSITHPNNINKKLLLSDIPISLHKFSVWFSEKIIKKNKETYFLGEFIRDMITGLIQPIMNDICLQTFPSSLFEKKSATSSKNKTEIRPRISTFTLPGAAPPKRDPLTTQVGVSRLPNASATGAISRMNSTFATSAIEDALFDFVGGAVGGAGGAGGAANDKSPISRMSNVVKATEVETVLVGQNNKKKKNTQDVLWEYYFIHVSEERGNHRKVNYIKDLQDGVYHFRIGSSTGLVKEINFTKNQIPYYQEAVMQGTNFEWLRRLFDAEIKMYGASSFVPGQKIYIDPSSIDLGHPYDNNSLSHLLGLGGYYIITNVKGEIESGKFDTVLTCKWESRGNGIGFKDDMNSNSNVNGCFQDFLKQAKKNPLSKFALYSKEDLKKYFFEQPVIPIWEGLL